jgi:hypothetical protein
MELAQSKTVSVGIVYVKVKSKAIPVTGLGGL